MLPLNFNFEFNTESTRQGGQAVMSMVMQTKKDDNKMTTKIMCF